MAWVENVAGNELLHDKGTSLHLKNENCHTFDLKNESQIWVDNVGGGQEGKVQCGNGGNNWMKQQFKGTFGKGKCGNEGIKGRGIISHFYCHLLQKMVNSENIKNEGKTRKNRDK